MTYEYRIVCLRCRCMKGQGGFTEPVFLTPAQVLGQAAHNTRCPVITTTEPNKISVESQDETSSPDAIVTRYSIQLAR